MVRNPKDNAVSYYHHHRISTFLGNYSGSWDEFVDLFAKGYLVYGPWLDHVRGFWELKQRIPDSVLFVSYEELKVVCLHFKAKQQIFYINLIFSCKGFETNDWHYL